MKISLQTAGRSGTRVIVAKGISFGYGAGEAGDGAVSDPLIRNFSVAITRGDKIGIIGPNGVGKTTLIQLLLGRVEPDLGTVEHGTSLEVQYFDQHREQLDEAETVVEAVTSGSDHVELDGEPRHVMSYLGDFLFTPDRARQPVRSLSGGERNRLLLARLFTRRANVLVLDEPTNDLDAETLELLESRLVDFGGTVLVVSHDRAFLDNLCTSTLVFEEGGRIREFVGGYSDWRRVVEREPGAGLANGAPSAKRARSGTGTPAKKRKLTYKEQRELAMLPGRIEELEAALGEAHEVLADPSVYSRDATAAADVAQRAKDLEEEIEVAFDRWSELADTGS